MHRRLALGLVILLLMLATAGVLSLPDNIRVSLFGGRRERALALITQRGGRYRVDEKQPGKPVVKVDLYSATEFTDQDLNVLGLFPHVRSLDLMGTRVTDRGIARLAEFHLDELQTLDLMGTVVTDAALDAVARFKSLRGLGLHGTRITDGGLERIGSMEPLQRLNIGDTHITDDGLRRLQRLTHLRVLGLEATGTTDEGLSYVVLMTGLRDLNLGETRITDSGLEQLARLTELRKLKLLGCRISDAGLSHLASLHELESLNLDFTPIHTVAPLKGLKKLRELRLRETRVPGAEIEQLRGSWHSDLEITR